MGRLFGTDGARGIANTELTCELSMNIGRAAAVVLTEEAHHRAQIIIGKDTRISSDMLESALIAGICSVGADVLVLGVVPTPAVACLVRKYNADAGIMISASHNPVEYNGIKIFNGEGYKLSDSLEEKIEALVLDGDPIQIIKQGRDVGRVRRSAAAVQDYIGCLVKTVEGDLSGLKIAVDCANGSASATAPALFAALNAECDIINSNPDGVNINHGCGSTHIAKLAEYVRDNNCDIGVAFDGDADRCLAVDENGEVLDGDKLIAIYADDLKRKGRLKNNTMVVTVLSNLGFFRFGKQRGINVAATKVGDRYVLEEMLANGYVIGGEQSGHVIFLDHATTGDGQLSAIQLLSILKQSDKRASVLASIMQAYPQTMVNVKVGPHAKERLAGDAEIQASIRSAEAELSDDGRVLVRASGTEPLIRVMVEGKDPDNVERIADSLAAVISMKLA
ncbi:MAG: phosphoglucosamine mutase [Clostridia bacterium]|nr:phosphoglucosamine mutase [Clostridia bacterium]MDR3643465.1 phosphoglucosamine mutase [Clostridia bacterium]